MKKNICDDYIDLTITSPPYDNLRNYNGYIFDYKSILNELYRVTKKGGVVVWIVNDKTKNGSETGTSFKQALYAKEIGFRLHDTMIYAKNNPVPSSGNRYQSTFEYMFILSKGKPKTFHPLKRSRRYDDFRRKTSFGRKENGEHQQGTNSVENSIKEYNIWFYNVGGNLTTKDKIAFKHPAVFPDKLAEDHIKSWSNEGDIILDPMCGSGTVPKIAWLNNRKFIGIDISEEYIKNICIPRLQSYNY
jgi:site-specific DNA-methyltransferase (adenine-specific)